MYKHILVAVAFDADHEPDQSLQAAELLAGKDGQVTVLHVKEAIPGYALDYMPEDYDAGLKEAIVDRLEGFAKRFRKGKGVLLNGHAARTILEWAETNDVDCIVITSHRPDLKDYFLGSTASRVVRHAPCSVHVVR